MEDTLKLLEEEFKKAKAEADEAEKEAAKANMCHNEVSRNHQQLMARLQDEELRTRKLRFQLADQQAASLKHRKMMTDACALLVAGEQETSEVKDDEALAHSLEKVAMGRMASFEKIQPELLASCDIRQKLLHGRMRVTNHKNYLASFGHPLGTVDVLKEQIKAEKEYIKSLTQEEHTRDESLKALKEQIEAEQQDVRSYRRRNEANLAKLKTELGCVAARNARLNLELSAVEREVSKMRDRYDRM